MKPRLFIFVFIASISLVSLTTKEDKFYYAFGDKIILSEKINVLLVKYIESINVTKEELLIKTISPDAKIKWRSKQIFEITTNTERSKEEIQAKLKLKEEVISCQPDPTHL